MDNSDLITIECDNGNTIMLPKIFHLKTTWNNVEFIAVRMDNEEYLLQWISTTGIPTSNVKTKNFMHGNIKSGGYIIKL